MKLLTQKRTVVGTIDREKVRVEVTDVQDKIAICGTYRRMENPQSQMRSAIRVLRELDDEPLYIPETLEIKNADLPPPLDPKDSYVKANDRAIQVLPEAKSP